MISWAISCELSYRDWNPQKWKKLTTWWHELPQLGQPASKKWLTIPETIRMTLIRLLHDQLQEDCERRLCGLYMWPFLPPRKAPAQWLSAGGAGRWTGVLLPPPPLQATKIKQTFLSTNLPSLVAFEQRAAGPPLLIAKLYKTCSVIHNIVL